MGGAGVSKIESNASLLSFKPRPEGKGSDSSLTYLASRSSFGGGGANSGGEGSGGRGGSIHSQGEFFLPSQKSSSVGVNSSYAKSHKRKRSTRPSMFLRHQLNEKIVEEEDEGQVSRKVS